MVYGKEKSGYISSVNTHYEMHEKKYCVTMAQPCDQSPEAVVIFSVQLRTKKKGRSGWTATPQTLQSEFRMWDQEVI